MAVILLLVFVLAPSIWLGFVLIKGRGGKPYSTGGTPLPPVGAKKQPTWDGLGWP